MLRVKFPKGVRTLAQVRMQNTRQSRDVTTYRQSWKVDLEHAVAIGTVRLFLLLMTRHLTIFIAEICLGSELMTGFIAGRTQLSRITVGSLEDLGYEVDYSSADYLGPDDVNPQCFCDDRRSLFEREHGEVTALNHPRGGNTRRLSDSTKQMAMEKGAEILEMQHQKFLQMTDDIAADAVGFAADKVVSVIVQEGEDLFGVIVHRE